MNHPFPAAGPITDPDTVAAWAEYEQQSATAAAQYREFPSSLHHLAATTICDCGKRTAGLYGICRDCWRAATS